MILEKRWFSALAVFCFVCVPVAYFCYLRSMAPNKSEVNGTYYSECCGNIVLKDGGVAYKKDISSYDLKMMKFGLTAYLHGKLTERGIEPSSDLTACIFFDRDRKLAFKTIVQGRESLFVKAR